MQRLIEEKKQKIEEFENLKTQLIHLDTLLKEIHEFASRTGKYAELKANEYYIDIIEQCRGGIQEEEKKKKIEEKNTALRDELANFNRTSPTEQYLRIEEIINQYKQKIAEAQNRLSDIQILKQKFYRPNNYQHDIRILKNKMIDIKKEVKIINRDIKIAEDMQYKLEWRPRYETYAQEHNIQYKDYAVDYESIFLECNRHHNLEISEGRIIPTKCYKQDRECTNEIVLNTAGSSRCECGRTYWVYEDPPTDLHEFNLDTTYPCGYMDTY
jgi:hypothetical protein